ncbi:uncharacterized protein LOC122663111 [Telopea speciosissima]|uniref:uncharacterized protein LOC122663111 n=1 Tax=Telopea speciosissima TaxID=54955 RepID=UPI001CC457CE|nr:uncharacterized protein LOC122663111 [Telopea speciosissima]
MRKRTGQKDLVRAAVTRFATACLTCQSLVKHKDALKHLFIFDEWKGFSFSKIEAEKKVEETVFAVPFGTLYSKGSFGRDMAIRQQTTINPITWWSTNGGHAFELSMLARCILGLCCSSSSCERNWSTFEFIHTKKRNRLEHSRLNDLVYVQYNSRLQERFQQRRELEGKNKKYDPLILNELDWSSEWMVTQPVEDLVHPNDDLTWDDVGRAMGASIEAPILPRRTQASTFGVDLIYSRRGHGRERGSSRRADVQDDSEPDEDEEEEEDDVNDDENVVDDYEGIEEPRQENLPNADLLDEYDN